jgi:hypothetical protein
LGQRFIIVRAKWKTEERYEFRYSRFRIAKEGWGAGTNFFSPRSNSGREGKETYAVFTRLTAKWLHDAIRRNYLP